MTGHAPVRIAIAGAAGRMGAALAAALQSAQGLVLTGGSERAGSPALGKPCGTGLIHDSVAEAAAQADVWIDFTTPQATILALEALAATPARAAIVGTTGLDAFQEEAVARAAQGLVIVKSGNFSLGVNLLAALVRRAAATLGSDWDIEIVEAHHRRKADAPSGTALMLGGAAADGRAVEHDAVAEFVRHGQTGPRADGAIGYAVLRGGGIVGDHDVLFASEEETLRLAHSARTRDVFAKGALRAARWACEGQPPGLYSMDDVLALPAA